MKPAELLDILRTAEGLKCHTRHCDTSIGRRESVAEHSWRVALMAVLLRDEFPDTDIQKVVVMALIHDLGEIFTGDIPAFHKTEEHRRAEEARLNAWVGELPEPVRSEFSELFAEMKAMETPEARLCAALDKLEAVIQHNEAEISSWLPLEYDLQLRYGAENVAFSPYLRSLKAEIDQWTERKIRESAAGERGSAPSRR